MEATDKLVDLVDRHISTQSGGGRTATGDRVLNEMVPEAKVLNLRGGQPSKFIGPSSREEKGDDASMSPEETALVKALIRELMKLESAQ